jgi:hypothetical protein
MKLIEKFYTGEVDYFGIKLLLPDGFSYLATDQDGEVWAFYEEPYIGIATWQPKHYKEKSPPSLLAKVDLKGLDWKETLKYYPEED